MSDIKATDRSKQLFNALVTSKTTDAATVAAMKTDYINLVAANSSRSRTYWKNELGKEMVKALSESPFYAAHASDAARRNLGHTAASDLASLAGDGEPVGKPMASAPLKPTAAPAPSAQDMLKTVAAATKGFTGKADYTYDIASVLHLAAPGRDQSKPNLNPSANQYASFAYALSQFQGPKSTAAQKALAKFMVSTLDSKDLFKPIAGRPTMSASLLSLVSSVRQNVEARAPGLIYGGGTEADVSLGIAANLQVPFAASGYGDRAKNVPSLKLNQQYIIW